MPEATDAEDAERSLPPDEIQTVHVTAPEPRQPSTTSSTAAGTLLGGRYRLRTRVGSDTAAAAEFWQAEDTVLQRDVAVTVLRRLADTDSAGRARAGEMVVRALRTGSFEHPGCSRLLDVLSPGGTGVPEDVLGAAVTEWVPGRSLAEAVTDGLVKPLTAARWVAPLAAAAEEAHRHGLVLGCDHPQRVRITPEGRAQLCFALPRPDTVPADDVRGLGAVLYTLLTSRWPLSGADAARSGLAAADRTAGGRPAAPSTQRPGVPVELDTVAVGALGASDPASRVHTAAAVHRLLEEVVAEDDTLFPPEHDGIPADPGDVWQDGGRRRHGDPQRRRKLLIGLGVLAAAVLLVVGYVAVQVGSMFSDGGSGPVIRVGAAPAAGAPAVAGAVAPAGSNGLATPVGVAVYSPTGDLDNADAVGRIVDGDPATNWRTYTYRQPFPALKPGVGVMVSFASAVQLASLTIDSPSAGTVLEIRSAPTPGGAVADTTLIGRTTLGPDTTEVSLAGSQPVTHVLLWITKLGGGDDQNVTQVNEVQFHRATG